MLCLVYLFQPIWDAVVGFNPQVFILLGDNIYGDNKRPFKIFGRERTIGPWKNVPRFLPASEQEMEAKYQKAKSNPGYARVKESAEVFILSFYSCSNIYGLVY